MPFKFVKRFTIDILISLAIFIIMILIFGSIFNYGNEGNMNGWVETWVSGIVVATLIYYKFRLSGKWKSRVFKSILNIGLIHLQLYLLVVVLKFDFMYGGFLLFSVPLLLPINKVLLELAEKKLKLAKPNLS